MKADITVVLDRSGSMESIKDDTIGGFNRFLKEQREVEGEALVTLHQFDDRFETVFSGVNVKDAKDLTDQTFVPRGWTALLDAVGRSIVDTGDRIAAMPQADRPNKVIFVIVTDGHENHSQEFTLEKVKGMIEHQTKVYSWDFVYLGANQDAIDVASRMGIHRQSSMSYAANKGGTQSAYGLISKVVGMARASGQSVSFSDADREEQRKAGE